MSCRLQMKHKLYIKMKVNGVATAIPETIKVSDNDLSKSLTGHKSRSETKREVINTESAVKIYGNGLESDCFIVIHSYRPFHLMSGESISLPESVWCFPKCE